MSKKINELPFTLGGYLLSTLGIFLPTVIIIGDEMTRRGIEQTPDNIFVAVCACLLGVAAFGSMGYYGGRFIHRMVVARLEHKSKDVREDVSQLTADLAKAADVERWLRVKVERLERSINGLDRVLNHGARLPDATLGQDAAFAAHVIGTLERERNAAIKRAEDYELFVSSTCKDLKLASPLYVEDEILQDGTTRGKGWVIYGHDENEYWFIPIDEHGMPKFTDELRASLRAALAKPDWTTTNEKG